MLSLEEKKAIVADVAARASTAQSAIAAEYAGLSVDQLTKLRNNARKAGVYLRVVKNTLARRAVADTEFACIQDVLTGPLILALSTEEPGAAARVMTDFAKDNDKLVIKVVALPGKLLQPADAKRLATLPTRNEAISQLMAVMKAPISKFVRTLAEPANKLARTVAAVRDQKQGA
ncbi:MAG: 50S ribosomal protein L10 [Chromatiales bacterium]|nr:50S ribosomal protein L10 [Chromatiales bacterium]